MSLDRNDPGERAGPPWLVVDAPYLCHRAHHSTGALASQGEGTGVVYGFLREVLALRAQFSSDRFVFCFDRGKGLREQRAPTYKANRRAARQDAPPEERRARAEFRRQCKVLQDDVLPALGFRNVLAAAGYEADDVIASAVRTITGRGGTAVMVAADKDLYQCLSADVVLWDPQKKAFYGVDELRAEFFIGPSQWPTVKALAGCPGDNVIGIPGVGEKSAARYVNGSLPTNSAYYKRIHADENNAVWERNLPLVTLPYPGTPEFDLAEGEFDRRAWRRVLERYGMRTLWARV